MKAAVTAAAGAAAQKGVSIWLVKQQPNHNHRSKMAHSRMVMTPRLSMSMESPMYIRMMNIFGSVVFICV